MSSDIPYDLNRLLRMRPRSTDPNKWTERQYQTVDSLKDCWSKVKFWEWGSDEEWAILEPIFDSTGNYIGGFLDDEKSSNKRKRRKITK